MGKPENEDDKPTVVLDLASLKREAEAKLSEIKDLSLDIEFATTRIEEGPELRFCYFTFQSEPLSCLEKLSYTGKLLEISELNELNKLIKEKQDMLLFFYFDQNPKAINQLCAQIKSKFHHVKVILVTKNLSDEKKKIHQTSPAGAYEYLTLASTPEDLEEIIKKI